MVVVVVLDLVSIPGAHVLVVVLVHFVSLVVLVLDEIVVVVGLFVIAVSMFATRTVVAHVVGDGTLSVAAVVVDLAVWIHHVWSVPKDRLLQFSSASLAFLALRAMPYAAVFLHIDSCRTMRYTDISSFSSNDPS